MSQQIGHSRKPSGGRGYTDGCRSEDDSKFSDKISPKSWSEELNVFCEDCKDYMRLKLKQAEQSLLNKDKFITLLQQQLEQMKGRNMKSITETQEVTLRYYSAVQELHSVKDISKKYEQELRRSASDRSEPHVIKRDCRCSQSHQPPDKWKKQDSEGSGVESTSLSEDESTADNRRAGALECLVHENRRMEAHVAELQLELSRSAQRLSGLENSLGEARREADQALALETGRLRAVLQQESNSAIGALQQQNDKLETELKNIRIGYEKLQNIYNETEKAFNESVDQHGSIISENETLKSENKALLQKLGMIAKQVASIKGSALMRNKVLRTQLRKSNLLAVVQLCCDGSLADSQSDSGNNESTSSEQEAICADYIQQTMSHIENLNEEYSEMHLKLQEAELHKSLALMENQNDKYKEKIDEQNSFIINLQRIIEELKEENCEGCNKIEEILEENEQLKKGFEEMLTEIEFLRDDLKSKNNTIKQQECKIARLLHDSQRNEQNVHDLDEKIKSLQNEISKKSSKISLMESNSNDYQVKMKHFEHSIKSLNNENTELKQTVMRLEKDKSENSDRLSKARDRISQLEAHFSQCKANIEGLQTANEQLRFALDEGACKYKLAEQQNRQQSESFSARLEQLDSENSMLKATVEESKCKCDNLAKNIESLSFYHENQMVAKNARFDELKQENQRMQDELKQLSESFDKKDQLYQKVLEDMEAHKTCIQEVNKTKAENNEMRTAVDVLRSILNDSLEGIIANNQTLVDNVDLTKVASEIYIKLAPSISADQTCNCKYRSSIKCTKHNGKHKKFSCISKIPTPVSKRKFVQSLLPCGEDAQVQTGTCHRTNSLPNLTDNFSSIEDADLKLLYKSRVPQLVTESEGVWGTTLQEARKLHSELQNVTDQLAAERSRRKDVEPPLNYCQLVQELQKQVGELQARSSEQCCQNHGLYTELATLKHNVTLIGDMQQQILQLKEELEKERVNRIQEFEVAKIKKEEELRELRQKLKDEFLSSRKTLLTNLTTAQNALEAKNMEGMCLKKKCEELTREIVHKQELRKKKLAKLCSSGIQSNVIHVPSEAVVHPAPPMLACLCAVPPQRDLTSVLRAQLHSSVTRHRFRSDSLPVIRSHSEEELAKKYLIN